MSREIPDSGIGCSNRRRPGPRPGETVDIRLSLAGSAEAPHSYELAGLRLASDLPLRELAPFATPSSEAASDAAAVSATLDEGALIYAGPGWVGGRLRQVECRRGRVGYLLRIEGAGEFTISADGGAIGRGRPICGPGASQAIGAAVLGPCLVLALALRDVFCLHASAAGPARAAVALAGESGSGKSTLAAALAADAAGWRPIGDDLLPVRLADTGVLALPCFPQANLAPAQQWRPPAPAAVDLAAIYILEPGSGPVEVHEIMRRRATLALVGQTVAARLFAAELQARHLDFCAELARRLPVRALRFPQRLAVLPAMTAAVLAGRANGAQPVARTGSERKDELTSR